jgi:uncharacterized protein
MADYDSNRIARGQTTEAGAIDAGLRAYMLRVYNYMFMALVVTGFTAFSVYSISVTTNPAEAAAQMPNGVLLTSIGAMLFGSPLKWVLALAPLGLVIFINARLKNMSLGGAQTSFWLFSGLVGTSLATIFMIYATGSIAQVFFITAAAFGGLSLYGYTTKTDLSAIGSFLIMGAWGVIIAVMVNWFFASPMLMWIVSVAGVGIFAGLTAYNTQQIKEMYYAGDDGTLTGKKAIWGALALYIDFINMFQFLLYLIGGRR